MGTISRGASLLAVLISNHALAQTVTPYALPGTVEEQFAPDDIVVTATKRERTLREVPISVSVTGQDVVEKAQIRDLIDLQSVVPSLRVEQFNATGQTNFIIRGFGNGNGNDGIESSVGVFIDGVYRSRSAAALDDLPEIERIEVLRGPQSTLFGKNVSAGAISIVTKKPQFEFGAKAEVSVGNYGLMQTRASITGPLSDTIAIRLSGNVNERNGFSHNITTGLDAADRNRRSVRADLLWQPSSDFSVRVIADYNLIKELCCGVTSIQNGPTTQLIGAPPPFGLGAAISHTSNIFARNVVFNANPQNRVRGKGISAQMDWNVGFAKLTSITAHRNQVSQSEQDIDFTGADLLTNTTANRIRTFTQEFRLTSIGDGPINWLAGAFYQDEKTDTGRDIRYGKDIRAFAERASGSTAALVAAVPALAPLIGGTNNLRAIEILQNLVTPSIGVGTTYFQPGQGISDRYLLAQRSFSLFGQADYKVTDRLTVSGGLAYLNDHKAVISDVVLQDPFASLNLQAVPQFPYLGLPGNLYGPLGVLQFFYGSAPNHAPVNIPNANESGIVKGDKITYTARIAYDLGFVNAYVSYGTGWKASAVNLSSDSRPPDASGVGRFANPENVKVYEAGMKAKFAAGFVNLAIFKQIIDGFQSNAFTGIGYSLVNAGKESVKGFEVDSAYRPLRWLALTAAATFLDGKYDSFVGAPCVTFDAVHCPINPLTGLRPASQDLSGRRPADIPKWSVSTSATITQPLGPKLSIYLRGEFDYVSNVQLSDTTPPNLSTWGISKFNASVGVVNSAAKLEVMVWVRNLTKDNYVIAVFPTVAQDGSYSGYPGDPRTFGMTVRKTF
jgi:iron complex outermembrane receptor protein